MSNCTANLLVRSHLGPRAVRVGTVDKFQEPGADSHSLEALRIEGLQQNVFGQSQGDLLTIGDSVTNGIVNNIVLTDVELIDPGDPGQGYCALRIARAERPPALRHR